MNINIISAPPRAKIIKVFAPKLITAIREKKEPVRKFYVSNTDNRIIIKFNTTVIGVKQNSNKFESYQQNTDSKDNAIIQNILNIVKNYMKTNTPLNEIVKHLSVGNYATSFKVFYNAITKPVEIPTETPA